MAIQVGFHWEMCHALATCTSGEKLLVDHIGNVQFKLPLKMHSCKHPHDSTLQACKYSVTVLGLALA